MNGKAYTGSASCPRWRFGLKAMEPCWADETLTRGRPYRDLRRLYPRLQRLGFGIFPYKPITKKLC